MQYPDLGYPKDFSRQKLFIYIIYIYVYIDKYIDVCKINEFKFSSFL